jgi:hypothetical protein
LPFTSFLAKTLNVLFLFPLFEEYGIIELAPKPFEELEWRKSSHTLFAESSLFPHFQYVLVLCLLAIFSVTSITSCPGLVKIPYKPSAFDSLIRAKGKQFIIPFNSLQSTPYFAVWA